ncbi:ATP-binding cassette domain-containing protein [Fulvimarina sp. 2208YS6-2-32]|uniref:ATP-binding cassette domain-containing protein n=1 Tax=Fulvimarina uroteuthidis TaxID=3098149 RepID=A0ABU5I4U5_9HYPH|nr:ATP-binding cassette domain-containing protein [Fulvimarina sp. 2208YS6-2-32]MDY8109748.1 ATP-binding cassette domain-containing protein [Fulvimarina sp. 2208YS6-2-32]
MPAILSLIGAMPRPHRRALILFTLLANVAVLGPSLHMLQIYDRVLASGSVATLVGVTVAVLIVLSVYGLCEFVRSRIASRLAADYTMRRSAILFAELAQAKAGATTRASAMRDFSAVRQFIGSKLFTACFDLPFVPFYLALLALVHWSIGVLGALGIAAILFLAWLNSVATRKSREEAQKADADTMGFAQSVFQRAEDVRAMGLLHTLMDTWTSKIAAALNAAETASEVSAPYAAASRTLRLTIQVLVMALGGWLVLEGAMSAGLIFLASMVSGRLLAPIDALIGGWDQMIRANAAYKSIEATIARREPPRTLPDLGEPTGVLHLSQIRVDHRSSGRHPVLRDVSLELAPGMLLVLIGPSGEGKSLLARIIAGASEADAGRVTMDGIPTMRYPRHQWASISGYQPQMPNLFQGTIASNIARFRRDVDMPAIYQAASRAGAHQAILSLANGYQEIVGRPECEIPAGLVQRIALARALIGRPRLVVLDEPLNHLDTALQARLMETIESMRAEGTSFVVVCQKHAMVRRASQVLMVRDGTVQTVQVERPKADAGRQGPAVVARPAGGAAAPGSAFRPAASTAQAFEAQAVEVQHRSAALALDRAVGQD